MLLTLGIRNLAIVENARVEFAPGLNVITGETGAGKSILVGALALVLGERADKTAIRAGEDQCAVEAAFALADPSGVDAVLDELGLAPTEEGRLIVRRSLSASGSGRNWINDSPATVQALKRVGDLLVDMHGPHEHQSLLSPEFQLDVLDSFGHLWTIRADYETAFREHARLEEQRRAIEGESGSTAQQVDWLTFQVKEIEEAKLTPEDEAGLEEEHARVAHAQQILAQTAAAREALTEAETSAAGALAAVLKALAPLGKTIERSADWRREAEAISVQVRELSATLNDYAQGVDADPARLQWLEDRMALVHKLKRKYGGSVESALRALTEAKARLTDLETRGERLRELEARIAAERAKRDKVGRRLGDARREAAGRLAKAITAALRGLGFAHGAFAVDLRDAAPRLSGADDIEYGFAPNVGEPMRALRAIASSGEISRVMLAVKSVLARHDRIPLLVFDEVDANVGGEMGNAIGARLREIAEHHQVVCITHLPQVAVHGVRHLVVAKDVRDGRTLTSIRPVEGEARVEEIARMLGGRDLTSVTLKHAREMLRKV
jgi:DNA repair protein RecN (Recombination protein N)